MQNENEGPAGAHDGAATSIEVRTNNDNALRSSQSQPTRTQTVRTPFEFQTALLLEPIWPGPSHQNVAIFHRPRDQEALALSLTIVSCAGQSSDGQLAPSETQAERVTQIPLAGGGDPYDVTLADEAVWVTSDAGLYRIDLATSEAVNVLPEDYLFRVSSGHGALWITTGSDGRVLRIDPRSQTLTAAIDVSAGPVTDVAVSEDGVWASASSDLVRIDPVTNEVVARLRTTAASATSRSVRAGCGSSPKRAAKERCGRSIPQRATCDSASHSRSPASGTKSPWGMTRSG